MHAYDASWVRRYYDEYGMKEWDRWDISPVERIKYFVHLHYLRQHIFPGSRVLEMGAGAGRFTEQLAKLTDRIVVADISPGQLALNRHNAAERGYTDRIEDWIECDMCDLGSVLEPSAFDRVVCYGGPLSYAFDRRDDAIANLRRVTAPGGALLFSVMSLWGAVHQYLPGVLGIAPETNRIILRTGDLTPDTVGPDRHYTHMFRSSELRRVLQAGGLIVRTLSASNALSAGWAQWLADVPESSDGWQHLLEMEIESCTDPGCLDMGTHIIAVCDKPASG
jgi:SAM-dependent methyltransferase